MRILVADDEADRREDLEELLADALTMNGVGADIVVVEDGAAAIEQLLDDGYRAAILDIDMPAATGLQVLQAVRPSLPELKIVMLTSSMAAADVAAARDSGADGYIVISADYGELYDQLDAIVKALFVPSKVERETKSIFAFLREVLTDD